MPNDFLPGYLALPEKAESIYTASGNRSVAILEAMTSVGKPLTSAVSGAGDQR